MTPIGVDIPAVLAKAGRLSAAVLKGNPQQWLGPIKQSCCQVGKQKLSQLVGLLAAYLRQISRCYWDGTEFSAVNDHQAQHSKIQTSFCHLGKPAALKCRHASGLARSQTGREHVASPLSSNPAFGSDGMQTCHCRPAHDAGVDSTRTTLASMSDSDAAVSSAVSPNVDKHLLNSN